MFSTFVDTSYFCRVCFFQTFPYVPSYALDSSHVVFRGVLWLKVRDCIFVDATGVDSSFHFLSSGSILGNGYH